MRKLLSQWNSIGCWRRRGVGLLGAVVALSIHGPTSQAADTSLNIVSVATADSEVGDIALALQEEDTVVSASDGVEQVSFTELEEAGAVEAEPLAQPNPPVPPAEVAPVDSATLEMEQIQAARDVSALRVYRPITQITIDASLPEGLNPDQTRDGEVISRDVTPEFGDMRLMGGWAEQGFQWSATRLCHGPLYFEEVNLERYGYQCRPCLQPFVSGAHFFLTVPALPYKMTVHPPSECIYTLGHYRPGSRVPWRRNLPPWDTRAAVVEATVAVGLVFLIP